MMTPRRSIAPGPACRLAGRTRLARAFPLIFAVLLLLPEPASAQEYRGEGGIEEIVLLVEVASTGSADILGRVVDDTLFLPFASICDYLRIPYTFSIDEDTIRGEAPVGTEFLILRKSGRAGRDMDIRAIDPAALYTEGGEVYLRLDLFCALIGTTMQFDAERQSLAIPADPNIPLAGLMASRRRYGALAYDDDRAPQWGEISRRLAGSGAFEWEIRNGLQRSDLRSDGRIRLAGELLFGIVNIAASALHDPGDPLASGAGIDHIGWQFQIPDWSLLSRIAVGAEMRGARGVRLDLTNVPLASRQSLGYHDLSGTAEPGWTIELHDAARLVAVTTADSLGRYRFSMPVGYGTISRTITRIGPYGERIVEERTLRMNRSLIPPGVVDYAIAARADALRGDGIFDGEFSLGIGVLPWLSIGAEGELPATRGLDLRPDRISTAAAADLWLGGTSSFGVRFAPHGSVVSALLQSMPWPMSTISLSLDSFSTERDAYAVSGSVMLPAGDLLLTADAATWASQQGAGRSASATVHCHVAGIRLSAGPRLWWNRWHDDAAAAPISELKGEGFLQIGWSPAWRTDLGVRLHYDHVRKSAQALDLSARFALVPGMGLGLGYAIRDLAWRHGSFTAQLSLDLGFAGIITQGSYEQGSLAGFSSFNGGGTISGSGVRLERNGSIGATTIVVRAFEDSDGDGTWDRDEQELHYPVALLRSEWMTSESIDGLFPHVSPNTAASLEIDANSFIEHDLHPAIATLPLYTLPSTVLTVTIPFVRGFEVTGSAGVRSVDDSTAYSSAVLNGLTIELVSAAGTGTYRGAIYNAGEIVIPAVPAGAYTIQPDRQQMSKRKIRMRPLQSPLLISVDASTLPAIVFEPE